jgi:hypothetical protein
MEQKDIWEIDSKSNFDSNSNLLPCNPMWTYQNRYKNLRSYEVVFQREGYDVETIYWAGSIEEVQELAKEIAFRGGADTYRIVEVSGGSLWNIRLRASASDP